jgi:serine/threonine protein phosphatase PrpC
MSLPGTVAQHIRAASTTTQMEGALVQAFRDCDREFCHKAEASQWSDGSTACTVLIANGSLVCANTGDSKAILCRMGKAIPLSKEHKPHVPAESQRIKASGGSVVVIEGISRVNGNVACSRAIGDAPLKKLLIPDPQCLSRQITKGDEWCIIATDGLWDFVDHQRAIQVCQSSGNAQASAKNLVNAALANNSVDNIAVVVIDLRSFGGMVAEASGKAIYFNMAQKVRKLGDDAISRADFTQIPPSACGWLYKESGGGMLGRRWQRRWFMLHVITNSLAYDGSVHRNAQQQFQMPHFVLHYTDSEEKASTERPRKPQFIDGNAGAMREEQLDRDGMSCFSVFDTARGEPILLAAEGARDAEVWIRKLNSAFQSSGARASNGARRDGSVSGNRTLSMLEAANPNSVRTQSGTLVSAPNGSTVRTNTGSLIANGPLQLTHTDTGGLMSVGGAWHLTSEQMAEKDMAALGMPREGYVLSPEQATRFGVPIGSALIGR